MARIYQSRQLLDPSYVQMMNQNFQRQIDSEKERRNKMVQARSAVAQSIVGASKNIMNAAKESYDQYQRGEEINNYLSENDLNDPLARAAAERYRTTGDVGPMLSYKQQQANVAAQEAQRNEMAANRAFEERKRTAQETAMMNDKANLWIEGLFDKLRETGNVNDLKAADIAQARQYIRELKNRGQDTSLLEARLSSIIGVQPAQPATTNQTQVVTPNEGKTTKELDAEKTANAERIKDAAAALAEKAKIVDARNKEAVDAFNAEIESLRAERDNAGLTAEVKLPDAKKYVTKPTLNAAREGYKSGKITAKQMRTWGYKWNDEIGDWE